MCIPLFFLISAFSVFMCCLEQEWCFEYSRSVPVIFGDFRKAFGKF